MKKAITDKKVLADIYNRLYKFYGPQGWWPARTRFEIIVGAILTQNTAWANVEKAINNLRKARLLTPSKIKKLRNRTLARLIRPAGYYNVKTKRLKSFIDFLFSKYGGRLTRISRRNSEILRRELLSVNGIGNETCDSVLLYAFQRPVFVIDAYTKRIFSRHKLFKESLTYEETQGFFMDRLPKREDLYNEYHALIVRLGKDFCRKKPDCKSCPLKEVWREIL